MDKRFDIAREPALYEFWEKSGVFAARPESGKPPYVIMMPPPNVTGSLHMGHALTFTIQDILVRRKRQEGFDVLWQPGTDHAGIATQMMVERDLAERRGVSRRDIGRDAFLKEAWRWKESHETRILSQLRALGASADWSRLRFTLEPSLSRAVSEVFVSLYEQGLLYRAKRLVNWDPRLMTAVSDLEVQQREVEGKLWHLRYPVVGREDESVVVATTRPETFFGDTAVAVHPEDERLRHLVGLRLRLPFAEREIPVIADAMVDADAGSGAVKITPAHDFNDFEVSERHDLPRIDIFDARARLNDAVPDDFRGLTREEARAAVVRAFAERGLLVSESPHLHMVPHGDRSGVPLEPRLTDQWFCDVKPLAEAAMAAVEEGRSVFVPERWRRVFFEWMRDIRPWCVSRQLWWGHRIPAWYADDGAVFVAADEAAARARARERYGAEVSLRRDDDVLDTWFSSALWPFSTLGWGDRAGETATETAPKTAPKTAPTKTTAAADNLKETDESGGGSSSVGSTETATAEAIHRDLSRYYPGAVLVTGFDIIFFWVARMMMTGLRFMDDVPFRDIYIHALVRDAQGRKMSKTRGNVIEPLELTSRYGADAVRFTLASLAVPGRDVNLDPRRTEGYRNFTTKLWNGARFAWLRGARRSCLADFAPDARAGLAAHNAWIVVRVERLLRALERDYAGYRLDEAASRLHFLIWHEFCDWYLELAKSALGGGDGDGDDSAVAVETRATMAYVLDRCLRALHPIAPYITEEIWRAFTDGSEGVLAECSLPALLDDSVLGVLEERSRSLGWYMDLVVAVRARRAELRVGAGERLGLSLGLGAPEREGFDDGGLLRLAGLSEMVPASAADGDGDSDGDSDGAAGGVISWSQSGVVVHLHLGDSVDLDAERARLGGVLRELGKEAEALRTRLGDGEFLSRAPARVVEERRARLARVEAEIEQTEALAAKIN
ncbi:MAG: valine--tRNA ligase [Alphaproteobacteria bacterium]|nr:valine--tRNA ligase [Alphaproteobacteria bacterium]MDA8004002.1 valine--tRNA ligase [Alphaproteobacteria bacterium]MDA8005383.1 valine--tRNA ligase [Alphaproteobacteria bacterium]MDA8013476.1 valine--tRNA ligase [Alphaproteobacteria bacterium]